MRRYVLTGTPGAGKTSILRVLASRGYPVVAEAATDVIARAHARGVPEPWREPRFVGDILALQRYRLGRAVPAGTHTQLHDRSPICTLALARYLDRPPDAALLAEVDRLARERVYQRRVLFVRPLGFVVHSAARRISYEDALEFERVHERVYREHGYELVDVPAGEVGYRAGVVEAYLRGWEAIPSG